MAACQPADRPVGDRLGHPRISSWSSSGSKFAWTSDCGASAPASEIRSSGGSSRARTGAICLRADYEEAGEEMLAETDRSAARWQVVAGESKATHSSRCLRS